MKEKSVNTEAHYDNYYQMKEDLNVHAITYRHSVVFLRTVTSSSDRRCTRLSTIPVQTISNINAFLQPSRTLLLLTANCSY